MQNLLTECDYEDPNKFSSEYFELLKSGKKQISEYNVHQ